MKNLVLASCLGLLWIGSLSAQEVSRFSFDIGAGFSQPVGNTGRQLDTGWNVEGGGGFNFGAYVGTMIDLRFNSFGINSMTLNNLGFPGGNVHVFSATLDPIVHLTPHSHFDVYLTGGGGLFHEYQDFTQPAVAAVSGFNPLFGFYTAGIPVNQVLASYSVNKPGIDAGAGIAFGSTLHGKFFAEARYDRMFMTNGYHLDYLPISFGFRW